MKRGFEAIVALIMLLGATGCAEARVDTLTYAVFPYLPDPVYYREIIERRWAEVEPGIQLARAEWDCYTDGAPQYLLLARRSPYLRLREAFPVYARLEALAGAEDNHVILTP